MTMNAIIDRGDLVRCAQLLQFVIDDPASRDDVREAAAEAFSDLNCALVYEKTGRVALVPYGFRVKGFYTDMVAEFLLDLGEEVVAYEAVRVEMAKLAAAHVDNTEYNLDFRLDCLDALSEILASLKRCADELVET
jgi:hypothetical protein